VILWRRLREPHIARITGELAAFQCPDNGVTVADLAACGIHQIGAAFHLADQRVVEKVFRLWMQWRIDRDYVADAYHHFDAWG
jgi:hypothetical protein